VTAADAQEWIAGLALKPASIRRCLATFRAILDFAEIDPNAATRRCRSPAVSRSPKVAAALGHTRKSLTLDTYSHVLVNWLREWLWSITGSIEETLSSWAP
jgi:hypothetical protein